MQQCNLPSILATNSTVDLTTTPRLIIQTMSTTPSALSPPASPQTTPAQDLRASGAQVRVLVSTVYELEEESGREWTLESQGTPTQASLGSAFASRALNHLVVGSTKGVMGCVAGEGAK